MKKTATVIAHGSLRVFQSESPAVYQFEVRSLTKDAVESTGIPHVEVDRLLVDGADASFTAEVSDGARIEVFPFELSSSQPSLVRVPPLEDPKFLVDENSGRLASQLLILGFNVWLNARWNDADLARLASETDRIVLTRDIGLLKRSLIRRGYWLRSDDPRMQLSETIRRFDLWRRAQPFSRCSMCNVPLRTVAKNEVSGRVPPETLNAFEEFFACETCERIYWKGSHFERMQNWLAGLEQEFGPLTQKPSALTGLPGLNR